jgi:DNA-binding CsgD family transcriptional regulator
LTEVATLSATGCAVLTAVTNALELFDQPVIVLDRLGLVLETNTAAESMFDDEFKVERLYVPSDILSEDRKGVSGVPAIEKEPQAHGRRLIVGDKLANAALDHLTDRLQATRDDVAFRTEPIIVKSYRRPPIIIRVLPINDAARCLFVSARILLILTDLGKRLVPKTRLIARTFALSVAETRIAEWIAVGVSLEKAAENLRISRETARTQLKAVFAKTGTHRQSELVALLSRF